MGETNSSRTRQEIVLVWQTLVLGMCCGLEADDAVDDPSIVQEVVLIKISTGPRALMLGHEVHLQVAQGQGLKDTLGQKNTVFR